MLTVFTLKSCDTCKKALKWLDEQGVSYENHDVRTDGLTIDNVSAIVGFVGWETALNRRSTTWRGLDECEKGNIDTEKAVTLILANPTLLKRPVFQIDGQYLVGFDARSKAAVEAII